MPTTTAMPAISTGLDQQSVSPAPAAAPYQARTTDERHLAALMERLPRMEQVMERLQAHREACALWEKYQNVDDLGTAIDGLEAEKPLETPEAQRLYRILLDEKRAAYRDEKARLDHDMARSRFASIIEADAARLEPEQARALEDELNRFREDYALTLAKCQAAQK